MAVFGVFLTLELTELFLVIGNFTTKVPALPPDPTSSIMIVIGGWIGVITALVAWYASAAGVMNGHQGQAGLPGRQAAPRPRTWSAALAAARWSRSSPPLRDQRALSVRLGP